MQHSLASGLPRSRFNYFCRDFMNFIMIGAFLSRAKATRATLPQHRRHDLPPDPYAFLSARDLRGLVAAMVD
jgi:hypothetical protein